MKKYIPKQVDTSFQYNTDQHLWNNAKPGWNSRKVTVADGMIHVDGEGWVARFADSKAAINCLRLAGFTAFQKTTAVS